MAGYLDDLVEQNCRALADLSSLIDRLSDSDFVAPSDPCHGSSIGQQVRHIIEHGEAVIAARDGEADYHHRSRDPGTEQSRANASLRLQRLMGALNELVEPAANDAPVQVRYSLADESGGEEVSLMSSVGRELMFLQSHTIHHMALIGIMARLQGSTVPTGFGVAPSTRRYWAEQAEARRTAGERATERARQGT